MVENTISYPFGGMNCSTAAYNHCDGAWTDDCSLQANDKCQNLYTQLVPLNNNNTWYNIVVGGVPFVVQPVWSNADSGCVMGGPTPNSASKTVPAATSSITTAAVATAAAVAPSTFYISSRENSLKSGVFVLEIAASSMSNGANADMAYASNTTNQKWYFNSLNQLVNVNSGLCLTTPLASLGSSCGNSLTQVVCSSTAATTWSFTGIVGSATSSGTLTSGLKGQCAHVAGDSTQVGTQVVACTNSAQSGTCGGWSNEQWSLIFA